MTQLRILVVDDEQPARFGMRRALSRPEYEILEAEDGQAALKLIQSGTVDLVFLDLNMPVMNGLAVLRELGASVRDCEIVVVTANDAVPIAIESLRLGAADYITKPFEIEQLRAIARRVAERVELQHKVIRLQSQVDDSSACGALVGISRPIRQLYEQMMRAARAPVDILIRGETGTGKELVAREIHRLSRRREGPFVAVNTAAIAETLAESELFGHCRGAFTGAVADRKGVFEQANGGTLFLDEIGDMPMPAQAKILRALQERTIQPVGSAQTVKVDVRVISATHQNLEDGFAAGRFRQDLFYRIGGIQLMIPPLRARREDVLVLANFFLDRACDGAGQTTRSLSATAIDALLTHSWPGNVRELQHKITAATAMASGDEILPMDLGLFPRHEMAAEINIHDFMDLPLTEAKTQLTETFERAMITAALEKQSGNVSAAARQLGIHRQSLQQKISQLGLAARKSDADPTDETIG